MTADDIAAFLPEFWRDARAAGTPVAAILDATADMLDPVAHRLDTIDAVLDPRRCPPRMLPYLADMLGFAPLVPLHRGGAGVLDDHALRAILISAPRLARERGTRAGLERALQVVIGEAFRIEETAHGLPFHVRIQAEEAMRPAAALLEALIQLMKPAHVTHDIAWEGAEPDPPPAKSVEN